ncbi:hypothetical protein Pan189_28400 [Stratiformator vulcanicus]|uniref:Uncharacterized protein n=1 Tax=Stratiformator vulcanicus TaxID=2527980 RepID=A0A517R3L3_9PLAN|nr:hypothetical protein Pan189_28400 [Stratiformator vulcanicus]
MSDPDCVRELLGMCRPRLPHRRVECFGDKVIAGLRLNRDVLASMIRLKLSSESGFVNFFRSSND